MISGSLEFLQYCYCSWVQTHLVLMQYYTYPVAAAVNRAYYCMYNSNSSNPFMFLLDSHDGFSLHAHTDCVLIWSLNCIVFHWRHLDSIGKSGECENSQIIWNIRFRDWFNSCAISNWTSLIKSWPTSWLVIKLVSCTYTNIVLVPLSVLI